MPFGTLDRFQNQSKERQFKQELLIGVAGSTVYTLPVALIVQQEVVDSSAFIPNEEVLNLDTPLPSTHSVK